jgi:nucleotide-binding universal stress UspA family protein
VNFRYIITSAVKIYNNKGRMMFKKIYVPLDNSDVSDKLLKEVIKLAKDNTCHIRFAHVLNTPLLTYGTEMFGAADLENTILKIGQQLKEHVNKVIAQANLTANTEFVLLNKENKTLELSHILVADATKWNADLFVLGSHHLGSITHVLSGGVVEKITKLSKIPLLIVTNHIDV